MDNMRLFHVMLIESSINPVRSDGHNHLEYYPNVNIM